MRPSVPGVTWSVVAGGDAARNTRGYDSPGPQARPPARGSAMSDSETVIAEPSELSERDLWARPRRRTAKLPVAVSALEAAARERLSAEAFGYVAGGASSEATVKANRVAFERWQIVPRMLRDVAVRDLSTSILGTSMPAPVMLGPVGVQSIVHLRRSSRRGGRRRRSG